ncbi:hypothetical protein E1286_44130 [Nonomuraea terrae]|uniref:Thiamine-binding protein domain-containing protein n=1 Tax=Nonomuraea terrae TaxID=2530383 RepID=A0A4R4XM54_9ACTN|nr:hypothetical protein [Nonomuraea terrae]TDD32034.1 hypothetical protein E1286_44130 [Nonomuraea terrae]
MDTFDVILVARSNLDLAPEKFERQVAMIRPLMDWDAAASTWWSRLSGSRPQHVTEVINTLFEAARVYGTTVTVQLVPAQEMDRAATPD